MKNNIEEIPSEIFDWMNQFDFDSLNNEQQKKVLMYFTPNEYQEMVQANILCKDLNLQSQSRIQKKEALMQLFDQQYPIKSRLINNTNALWKAACVLLLFSTCWFAFDPLRNTTQQNHVAEIVKHDTVYSVRNSVKPIIQYDTVYVTKQSSITSQPNIKKGLQNIHSLPQANNQQISEPVLASLQSATNDINVLPISSILHISNNVKRNSMIEDSLERNFNFVSL